MRVQIDYQRLLNPIFALELSNCHRRIVEGTVTAAKGSVAVMIASRDVALFFFEQKSSRETMKFLTCNFTLHKCNTSSIYSSLCAQSPTINHSGRSVHA
jgi:hypothetical protein